MKSTLLFFSLAFAGSIVFAQDHYADKYNVSVYQDYKDLPFSRKTNILESKKLINTHFPQSYVSFDKLSGSFTNIYGKAHAIPGSTIENKIDHLFGNHLKALGVNEIEWHKLQTAAPGFAQFVKYKQHINGHEVEFSKLNFRFANDGRLERIQMKTFGMPTIALPALTRNDAKNAAQNALVGVTVFRNTIDENWVWFPVPNSNGYELRPAWQFEITGKDEKLPVELRGYVDGLTGEILYRNNEVKETIDLTVNGVVYKQNPLLPATLEPLSDLRVDINASTFYTDGNGFFSVPAITAPVVAVVTLEGKWSTVIDEATSTTPLDMPVLNNASNIYTFNSQQSSNDRMVNAYYHVGRVHNFMKGYFPAFTGLDFSLTTNVDYTGSPICNAFYSGGGGSTPPSINFAAASPGCNSFALCGDIIYHEYGHGINHLFYSSMGQGRMDNGALNEGHADVWGMSISADPVLGKGSFTNGSVIRRYDQAPKVYPQDLIGQVHNDGEIIAGAWWDLGQNLGALDTMTQLFTKTYFDVSDGPNGTEGEVYHSVLISALQNDDDDNNLTNGTPHFFPIISAFARHGIYLLSDAAISHTDIANQTRNTPITINASITVSEPAFLSGMKIFFKDRVAANWDSLLMTIVSQGNFTASLPGFPEGTIVDYYFAIYDNVNLVNAYFPINFNPSASSVNNNIPYQFGVGISKQMGEDFEGMIDPTWQLGISADDAGAAGKWIIASPKPTTAGGEPVQTGEDHTTGTSTGKCLVTGNTTGALTNSNLADVDSGSTSAITPVYDLSSFSDPVIEYFRWYSNDKGNNRGNDNWEVFIKLETASLWLGNVERTNRSDNSWRRKIFNVKQHVSPPVGVPFKVQLKFVASDKIVSTLSNNGQSTVEAAVDDIFIYDKVDVSNVNDAAAIKAKVYPNPTNNEINITLATKVKGVISVHDLTGKLLMEVAMNGTAAQYAIPTKALANGTYMIMIKTDKSIQTSKVSVIH